MDEGGVSLVQGGVILRKGLDGRSASVDLEGHLLFNMEGVTAISSQGQEHRLLWRAITFSRGGHSGERLFMVGKSAGLTIYTEDPNALRAIENAAGNELADKLADIAPEDPAGRRRGLVSCMLLIGLLGVIGWSAPRLFHWSIERAVDLLPYSVDEQIGEVAHASMDAGTEIEDEELRAFIRQVIDRLALHTGVESIEFRFRIVANEDPNAFALPGGYITVHSGLITEAERPEQVAGVLAHEMAHVLQRHGLRGMAHSLGLLAAVQLFLGDTEGLTGLAAELFSLATVNDYSQEQESAADREAVRIMHAAGLDPTALADFFKSLAEEHGDVPADLAWMSSHPQHSQRIEAIHQQQAALPAVDYVELDVNWQQLQELAR